VSFAGRGENPSANSISSSKSAFYPYNQHLLSLTYVKILLLFPSLFLCLLLTTKAQTEIPNGDFELWDNVGNNDEEPQQWSSNKTGGGIANTGPQTCFQESSNVYDGSHCIRVETRSFFTITVNGSATTGRVEAPNTNPANGYVHTIRANADFNSPFTGRPDSLVGYFRYEPDGNDEGKIEVYLHGDYDVENPDQGGSAPFIIATATFLTPGSTVSSWTRFSVPFTYTSPDTPQYILAVVASSAVAGAGEAGSKLWVDNLEAIYLPCETTASIADTVCDHYLSPSGKYLWTATGVYKDTIPNAAACDSIITVDLTINSVDKQVNVAVDGNSITAVGSGEYQWVDCNQGYALITGETGQTFSPAGNGTYALIITQNACTDTSECVTLSTVGLENEAFTRALRLFPNPAGAWLTVDWGEVYGEVELVVFGINGQELMRQKAYRASETQLDVSDLPKGIFLLMVIADDRRARVKFMR
jgi:hypothetical protein